MGKIGIVAATIGLIVGVAGVVGYGAYRGSYGSDAIDETKTVDAKQITNVQFDSSLAGVHIYPTKADVITTHVYGNTKKNNFEFTVEANGDTAILHVGHEHNISFDFFSIPFFTNGLQIDVELPEKVYNKVQASSEAGSIHIEQVSAGNFNLHCSAGSMTMENLKGDITAHDSAGSMHLTNVDGALDLTDSAGSITMQLQTITHDIVAHDSAGSIQVITKEEPSAMQFNLRTSAGSSKINFPDSNISFKNSDHDNLQGQIGTGGPMVELESSAGSISIGQ